MDGYKVVDEDCLNLVALRLEVEPVVGTATSS